MLTIEDLRNPRVESGFTGVSIDKRTKVKPFRAQIYVSEVPGAAPITSANHAWYGKWHPTAEEAAQERCDYLNGLATPRRVVLKTAGHKQHRKRGPQVPEEVAAAYGTIRDYRARQAAKGDVKNYVYLIAEWGGEYVKIGESAKPPARPSELQTGNARTLVLLGFYEVEQLRGADKEVHQQFADDHAQNEWFRPTDAVLSHFNITRREFLRRCGGKTKEVATA